MDFEPLKSKGQPNGKDDEDLDHAPNGLLKTKLTAVGAIVTIYGVGVFENLSLGVPTSVVGAILATALNLVLNAKGASNVF